MKKSIILISILTAIIMAASSCTVANVNQQSDAVMLSLQNAVPKSLENSQEIQSEFNLNLLKQLNKADKNVFFSSLSINQALTMAYFGATGETQQQMLEALGYGSLSIEDVAAYQKKLLASLNDSGDTTFDNANSIWVDNDFLVYDSYLDTMNEVFNTETQNVDFQKASTVGVINAWISKKTNGMIEKLFEENDTSLAQAKMVLMNAIYFKGEWTTPFNADMTFKSDFNGAVSSPCDMMSLNETVVGFEGDDYKAINLPYGDDERFSMIAVLPNGDVDSFIQSLSAEELNDILTTFENKSDAMVNLPKFEMEEKVTLNDALEAMGIKRAFTDSAEFDNISETGLMIDEILHKAKIKVDEKGTEAAAVTGLIMRATSIQMDRFEFIADKPFLIFIVDSETGLTLFTGKVCDLS